MTPSWKEVLYVDPPAVACLVVGTSRWMPVRAPTICFDEASEATTVSSTRCRQGFDKAKPSELCAAGKRRRTCCCTVEISMCATHSWSMRGAVLLIAGMGYVRVLFDGSVS